MRGTHLRIVLLILVATGGGLIGCGSKGGFAPPSLPSIASAPPLPTTKAPVPIAKPPVLNYQQMKQTVKKGMTVKQLRALLGTPHEDTGPTMLDEPTRYGPDLEKLSYIAPDGNLLVFAVKGKVITWFGGPSRKPQVVPPPLEPEYHATKQTKQVYLAPLSDFPQSLTQALVRFCQAKLKLTVKVLPPTPLSDTAVDTARQQLVAEPLLSLLKRQNPKQAEDSQAIVIGLTQYDMTMHGENLVYVFGKRDANHFAVISSARMNPISYGAPAAPELLQKRLQKMLLKDIGLMYYGRTESYDPKSVLYGSIGGLEDLDALGDEL